MDSSNPEVTLFQLFLDSAQYNGNEIEDGGRDRNRQEMMENFAAKIEREMPLQDFINKCSHVTNPKERIRLVSPFFEWTPATENYKEKFKKRSDVSSAHLKKVQMAFNKGQINLALQYSNHVIAHAPPGGSDLASAYYWRSLILYQLNDPKGALNDLDLALTVNDFPRNKLKAIQSLRATFEKAVDPPVTLMDTKSAESQQFVDNLFRLESPNPMAPAMADCVTIKFDSVRGRHLVLTKDVPIGTVLLVETPTVATLDGTLKLNTMHCHHCLKKNLRRIPCPNCIFALFCDETCLEASKSYHQYECPCLPDLSGILLEGVTENFYLAFKLICIQGPRALYKLFQCRSLEMIHNVKGLNSEEIYESSYASICKLVSMQEPRELLFPLIALMLSNSLATNTNYFDLDLGLDPNPKSLEFRQFIAEMILHHFECFWKNVFSLGNVSEFDRAMATPGVTWQKGRENLVCPEFEQFASRIFATGSLMNHSCNPNVKMFSTLTFGQGTVVTLKNLKEGQEILISYGPVYYLDDKQERQAHLKRCYDFECDCPPCVNDWRGINQNFENDKPQICCPNLNCAGSSNNEKIILNVENNFECQTCGIEYKENEIQDKFELAKIQLSESRRRLEDNFKILEGFKKLKEILKYFENNLIEPSFDFVIGQEYFSETINKLIENFDCS